MEIKKLLTIYITNTFIEDNHIKISTTDDILSTGIIDSLGMMKLIAYIEKKFNIKVLSKDITFDNFVSIEKISEYINYNQLIN